jgi:hypothetical protein
MRRSIRRRPGARGCGSRTNTDDVSHARAVVAGVLSVGVVLLLLTEGPLREPERAFAAFVALVSIIALLVGTDIVGAVKGRKNDDEDGGSTDG